MKSRWVTLAALLLLVAGDGRAQAPTARLKIELPNVRWQHMPPEVQGVYIGPDGRTWYQLSPEIKGWNLAQAKSHLQREFKEPGPQVSGAQLALLEPEGRAWFLAESGRLLLGYDGQTWIEHAATGKSPRFLGKCPTQGGFLDNQTCRFVSGRAWFSATDGIHTFDGREWTLQEFEETSTAPATSPQFAVSPSGKYAAAIQGKDLTLWSWFEGTWKRNQSLKNETTNTVAPFVVTDQGVLWHLSRGDLRTIDLTEIRDSRTAEEAISELLRQLGSEDFQQRETASEKLEALGTAIKPRLVAALKEATDVEVKLRLKKLLEKAIPRGPRAPIVATIGKYQVSEVKQLSQDDQGAIYLAAGAIKSEDDQASPGLLKMDAAGKATFVSNPKGLEPWWRGGDSERQFFVIRKQGLWLSRFATYLPHACFDLDTQKLTGELPDLQPVRVTAVDGAGRVYASGFTPGNHPTLFVYTPGAPEPRPALEGDRIPVVGRSYPFVARDGSIWVQRRKEGLSRFDGKEWVTVHPDFSDWLRPITSGEESVVLYQDATQYLLFQGNSLLGSGKIRDLVKKHRALLTSAFAKPQSFLRAPNQGGMNPAAVLAADKAGNIWLIDENQKVGILTGDTWLEAAEPLKAAGSRQGTALFLATFGDNSRVFLSEMRGLKSHIGQVVDGKLTFVDAPNATDRLGLPLGTRESDGSLWLAASVSSSSSTSVRLIDQQALRLGQNGQAQEIQGCGWPMLVDESGKVWLGRTLQSPQNKFVLWRGGKIVQRLEVPGTSCVHSLFSVKPGSVFAWSTMGLIHLKSEGDNGYRVAKTYILLEAVGLSGFHFPIYSKLGYIVANTSGGTPSDPRITLFRIPQE